MIFGIYILQRSHAFWANKAFWVKTIDIQFAAPNGQALQACAQPNFGGDEAVVVKMIDHLEIFEKEAITLAVERR